MNIYRPRKIIEILNELNAKPLKSLSQNFLIDKNIIDKIIDSLDIKKNDIILEIGPGLGSLTEELLKKENIRVIAVEKDKKYAKYLQEKFKNLTLYHDDFLKIDLSKILPKESKIKVIGNLPYNISTKIIAKLIDNRKLFSSFTLMLQYEMANRLIAKPNNKQYGSFTVYTDCYTDKKILFKISSSCFFPPPKIDSAIIQFIIKKDISKEYTFSKSFHDFTKKLFSQRRKKILTILKKNYDQNILKDLFYKIHLDTNSRVENLSYEELNKLYNLLIS